LLGETAAISNVRNREIASPFGFAMTRGALGLAMTKTGRFLQGPQ